MPKKNKKHGKGGKAQAHHHKTSEKSAREKISESKHTVEGRAGSEEDSKTRELQRLQHEYAIANVRKQAWLEKLQALESKRREEEDWKEYSSCSPLQALADHRSIGRTVQSFVEESLEKSSERHDLSMSEAVERDCTRVYELMCRVEKHGWQAHDAGRREVAKKYINQLSVLRGHLLSIVDAATKQVIAHGEKLKDQLGRRGLSCVSAVKGSETELTVTSRSPGAARYGDLLYQSPRSDSSESENDDEEDFYASQDRFDQEERSSHAAIESYLWLTLSPKGFRPFKIAFGGSVAPEIVMPKSLGLVRVAMRVLYLDLGELGFCRESLTTTSSKYEVVGGTFAIELFPISEEPVPMGGWKITKNDDESTGQLPRLPYPIEPMASGQVLTPFRVSLFVSKDIYVETVDEDDVRVGIFKNGTWCFDGITDCSFDRTSRRLSFCTIHLGTFAILQHRSRHHRPFSKWSIIPDTRDAHVATFGVPTTEKGEKRTIPVTIRITNAGFELSKSSFVGSGSPELVALRNRLAGSVIADHRTLLKELSRANIDIVASPSDDNDEPERSIHEDASELASFVTLSSSSGTTPTGCFQFCVADATDEQLYGSFDASTKTDDAEEVRSYDVRVERRAGAPRNATFAFLNESPHATLRDVLLGPANVFGEETFGTADPCLCWKLFQLLQAVRPFH